MDPWSAVDDEVPRYQEKAKSGKLDCIETSIGSMAAIQNVVNYMYQMVLWLHEPSPLSSCSLCLEAIHHDPSGDSYHNPYLSMHTISSMSHIRNSV